MAYVSSVGGILEEAATRLNEVSADEENYYLNWVNLCTKDIAFSFPNAPFNFTSADRTLSASTRQYTNLPSDFEKMITITYPGGDTKLKYIPEDQFDTIQPSASETGSPTIYTIHGATNPANSQIEFYPVPSTGITVNYKYRKLPTTVSTQSSTPPGCPPKYNELYILFIEKMGLRRREDFVNADKIEAKYETLKEKMMEDFKRITEEPWSIKSVRELQAAKGNYDDEITNMFWGN